MDERKLKRYLDSYFEMEKRKLTQLNQIDITLTIICITLIVLTSIIGVK